MTALLRVGGAFLCFGGFEGFEKLAHKLLPQAAQQKAERQAPQVAAATPPLDLLAREKDQIKGMVRADFTWSAEIIAITLGTVQAGASSTQVAVMSTLAVVMTLGVYGVVAGIVKHSRCRPVLQPERLRSAARPGARHFLACTPAYEVPVGSRRRRYVFGPRQHFDARCQCA